MTAVDTLLSQPGSWLAAGQDSGIVVSSRIRLARNLREAAFPGWAGEEECEKVWQRLNPILSEIGSLQKCVAISTSEVDDLDRQVLFERHLISREFVERGRGSGVVIRLDEGLSVMVNEEDHLRLQAMKPGLNLETAWKTINTLDDEIEKQVHFAFSPNLGYLTACPSNVGTGIRASVMLHLPGLVLMNEISPIIKGMGKIGLAVRGLWGEGTEAAGNMFQISNQITLGEKEEDIVRNIEQIVLEIIEHEKNARGRLMEKKDPVMKDHVGRAFGILSHAHILSSKEALDLLSGLRLGVDMGILKGVERHTVDELLLLTQPGHLQKLEGKTLKTKERDRARAKLVRGKLGSANRRL